MTINQNTPQPQDSNQKRPSRWRQSDYLLTATVDRLKTHESVQAATQHDANDDLTVTQGARHAR